MPRSWSLALSCFCSLANGCRGYWVTSIRGIQKTSYDNLKILLNVGGALDTKRQVKKFLLRLGYGAPPKQRL